MTLATPNSFLTLTANAPTFTLPVGAVTSVVGTTGPDSIVIPDGAAASLTGFNNTGDVVTLGFSSSANVTVFSQGSTVIIRRNGVDVLSIGAGTTQVPIQFSDTTLNLRIDTQLGQLVLGNQTLTSNPAPITGGGPTFTDVVIGSNGQLLSPFSFNAASGAFNYIDAVSIPSAVVINNFGNDDRIDFDISNLDLIAVQSTSTDVILTANSNGLVSQITLPGVNPSGLLIFNIATFNSLPVGDVV